MPNSLSSTKGMREFGDHPPKGLPKLQPGEEFAEDGTILHWRVVPNRNARRKQARKQIHKQIRGH